MTFLLILIFNAIIVYASDIWSVSIAGSSSWYNYRHQADVLHNQLLGRNYNISETNRISFIYNDTAYSSENPTPGIIVNQYNQQNVYKHAVIDYSGNAVNKYNFMNALKGRSVATGGKKVLQSTFGSYVVIYFSDHGGSNCISIINDFLYADELIGTLLYMYEHRMYSKLLFLLESCESGSMFNGLIRPDLNILAITASGPYEPSFACSPSTFRGTYLNDCFSINWLKNIQSNLVFTETIGDLFGVTKHNTISSTVCAYGDLSILQLPAHLFFVNSESFDNMPYSHFPNNDIVFNNAKKITPNMQTVIDSNKDDLYDVTVTENDFYLHNMQWPNIVNNYDIDIITSSYINNTQFYKLQLKQTQCDQLFIQYVQKYKYVNEYLKSHDNHCHIKLPKLDYECYRYKISKFDDIFNNTYCRKYLRYVSYECMDWSNMLKKN